MKKSLSLCLALAASVLCMASNAFAAPSLLQPAELRMAAASTTLKEPILNQATSTTVAAEQATEKQLQTLGTDAPRLQPEDIDAVIVDKTFTTLPSGKVMVCELTLRNGFTVRGEAAVVSKANFRREVGERLSYEQARDKVWELEGYLLQERLHAG